MCKNNDCGCMHDDHNGYYNNCECQDKCEKLKEKAIALKEECCCLKEESEECRRVACCLNQEACELEHKAYELREKAHKACCHSKQLDMQAVKVCNLANCFCRKAKECFANKSCNRDNFCC